MSTREHYFIEFERDNRLLRARVRELEEELKAGNHLYAMKCDQHMAVETRLAQAEWLLKQVEWVTNVEEIDDIHDECPFCKTPKRSNFHGCILTRFLHPEQGEKDTQGGVRI